MATVDKNFRVKNGLVVEGTTGTINGNNIVTDADTTDILSEGTSNLYFTDQRAIDAVTGGVNTDEITEGTTNLYFTAQRAIDAVAGGEFGTDVIEEGTVNLYFTDQRVQDVLVNAVKENIDITSTDGLLYITAENGVADSTTDDLAEGTVNLYFTAARVLDVVSGGGENFTTDSVAEGTTNLYFTDQRAIDAVISGAVDTDDIEEGTTNLYFTDQRAVDAVIAGAVDTDDIEEGTTNLYFTDDRARSSIGAGTGINYSSTDGLIYVDTDEIATKVYVDEVAQGLKVRGNVEAATTADLGGTYSNGTNGVDAIITIPATATLSIDGWTTWSQFDGVLVKDQTNAEENGRYFVDVVGDAETAWVLKRCIDCDTAEEIPGSFVFVQHGNTYEATGWVATVDNVDTFAVGTDDINWVQFSGAGTYTAGTGLDLDGTEFSLDATTDLVPEGTANLYFTDQRAVDAVIAGAVDTDDIEEGTTNLYFTDQRAVDAVINGAVDTDDIEEGTINLYYTDARVEDVIAASDTDNIAEGTVNLYFTAQRAIDAVAGGEFGTDVIEEGTVNLYYTTQRVYDDLANAVQENISITTTDGLLYVTAENGVADSTTDELDEGTINLYFTDQRAVDALEAVVPNFTEIEINSVSKQIAATTTVTSAETPTAVFTFDSTEYRSAKFIVKAAVGSHTEVSEVLLTLDTSDNIAITEYAIVGTNGNLIDVTATFSAGDVVLEVSAENANTDVTVFGTLIV